MIIHIHSFKNEIAKMPVNCIITVQPVLREHVFNSHPLLSGRGHPFQGPSKVFFFYHVHLYKVNILCSFFTSVTRNMYKILCGQFVLCWSFPTLKFASLYFLSRLFLACIKWSTCIKQSVTHSPRVTA